VNPWPRWTDLLPAVCIFGLVWYGSSIPAEQMPDSGLLAFDKLLHIGEYTVVGAGLLWTVRRSPTFANGVARFCFVLAAGLVWAILDEIHQGFVGRDSSMYDLLADCLGLSGIALASGLGWLKKIPGFERLWKAGTDKAA